MRSTRAFIVRVVGAVKIVIRDGRVPRPLRWGGGLGLLPIPGPFDELVLLVVGSVLWLFYRDQLTEAWQRADPGAFR
jgi:hypothetical protein